MQLCACVMSVCVVCAAAAPVCSRLLSYFRGGWNDACVFGAGNIVSAFRFRTHARIVVSTLRLNEVVAAPPDAPEPPSQDASAALEPLKPRTLFVTWVAPFSH